VIVVEKCLNVTNGGNRFLMSFQTYKYCSCLGVNTTRIDGHLVPHYLPRITGILFLTNYLEIYTEK